MKKLKLLSLAITFILLMVTFAACGTGEGSNTGNISKLSFTRTTDVELVVGKTDSSYFKVTHKSDFSIDDLEFVSSDPSIATFEYDKTALTNCIYYIIKSVSPGTVTVYAKTKEGDIKTEEIKVTVLPSIEELEFFSNSSVDLKVGGSKNSYFLVKPGGEFSIDDIEFISVDIKIATFEYDKTALTNYVYFNIKGISAGTTTVYAQTKDGSVKTSELTVTVK